MSSGTEQELHAAAREGAVLLRAGRLVAFPTETVYGLGANALDPEAVARIYEAKGRPPINPLIVHVADVHSARALARDWTPVAEALATAFWPGPITLVLRKKDVVPNVVSAGQDTVGLRVPAHPVALALLLEAGVPIAAPSANLSTQVSPTTAAHVARGLGDRVDLIIDGGPTSVGIESTVVDATGDVPRVLRPGMIARADIARVAGVAEAATPAGAVQVPMSPGLVGKHYAPHARVVLFDAAERVRVSQSAHETHHARKLGAMPFVPLRAPRVALELVMPGDPRQYARELYARLHAFDDAACDVVLVERPPSTPEWAAIRDRLERAATGG